jgi:hypothetical protein
VWQLREFSMQQVAAGIGLILWAKSQRGSALA